MPDDVIVIGAGPAGSVASILLARQGWRVSLFEQHRFPRSKVCGECLSALGIEVLSRAGLADDIVALRPIKLRRALFVPASGESVALDLPREMWGIRRDALDDRLLGAARAAGASVRELHRCESFEGGERPRVRVRDLCTNVALDMSASYLLLADGKAARGASLPRGTRDFGLKGHFTNVDAPADAITLAAACGHYVGLARVSETVWNVALSVPLPRLQECHGDGDAVLALMKRENASLSQMLRRASRVGDWLAAPLPRFSVAPAWPRRVIPLGNAAAALEPIGGEGMGLAMRSAELAAEALTTRDQPDIPGLRHAFDKLWRSRSRASRAAALVMSSPVLCDLAAQAASASESATRLAMSLVGK